MSISAEDRAKLVQLAKDAVAAQVTDGAKPVCDTHEGIFGEHRGCFVTLTNGVRLRGCIGTFTPRAPLAETIIEMGMAAAGQDPRFFHDPITPSELEQLTVEVSVLSPLEETHDPLSLEVGTHGIYIVSGGRSGCFLPEVATDWGWDAREFLDQCCENKAGLPKGTWSHPDTKVYLFTSEKFDH